MFKSGLQPAKITGSSAGALVGAGWASGLSVDEVKKILFSVRRTDFWDPALGMGLLRGAKLEKFLRSHFVSRIEDTKIPFEIAVFDIFARKTEFLNRGSLPNAVVASCAVPGLFQPIKRDGRWLWDGGVLNKPGVNPKDPRVLCVFLESTGLAGIYERAACLRESSSNRRVLRISGLPQVNFTSLEKGPRAFEAGYAKAFAALND